MRFSVFVRRFDSVDLPNRNITKNRQTGTQTTEQSTSLYN
jgi:hypothetical protein